MCDPQANFESVDLRTLAQKCSLQVRYNRGLFLAKSEWPSICEITYPNYWAPPNSLCLYMVAIMLQAS